MNNNSTIIFFAKVVGFSFLIGPLIALFSGNVVTDWQRVLLSGVSGAMIGSGCVLLEYFAFSNRSIRWLREIPLIMVVGLRAIAYSIIIVGGLVLPSLLFLGTRLWLDPDFFFSFWVSIGVATGLSMSGELFQLLGKEAALAVFTGRYRRPRIEQRIIMFADLTGSTALAEKLGDLRFHELLGDVAYDLEKPIVTTGGETHRYVGDAIIITWSMDKAENFERCLLCAKAMVQALEDKASGYIARYGQSMRMRIAIHCGPVAAGEIGAWKKEISLLGDTMNTTARIESAARRFESDIVVSDAIRRELPNELKSRFVGLPDFAAHGKKDALRLWAL
ncbi:adenylate/guanylate cyclase domain-containing protein [Sulfitobacter sp. JB4-11]|uniref:adenylate/guanylate cyclase domain-containing protein n=1 Tax=Sulfitobacter rhodophyticola TaxID=3238304 RepID=UPI003D819106